MLQSGQEPISEDDAKAELQNLYELLTRSDLMPQLYCKFHDMTGNLEYLAVFNTRQGLPVDAPPTSSLEEHARRFFVARSKLFRLYNDVFQENLFLKVTLHSLLGTHLIFGLRAVGQELDENCFVAHFDREQRLVMIVATYEPNCRYEPSTMPAGLAAHALDSAIANAQQSSNIAINYMLTKAQSSSGQQSESVYRPAVQIKYRGKLGSRVVIATSPQDSPKEYSADAGAGQYGVGLIYREYLTDKGRDVDMEPVVLRDLVSNRELIGRYASVQDDVDSRPLQWLDDEGVERRQAELAEAVAAHSLARPGDFTFKPDMSHTRFDRVMAYYHTDRIQRFFRELGLTALDKYDTLNPVKVVLTSSEETCYSTADQRIYLQQIKPEPTDVGWTVAHDARVIYHEFTHAVTDALARLHRGNRDSVEYVRRRECLMAAAIDEGLADYVACTLAARDGVRKPQFALATVGKKYVSLGNAITPRHLSVDSEEDINLPKMVAGMLKAELSPIDLTYKWGEQWGRYLWRLREDKRIGPQTADLLFAHSIFFLTRWATFELAVLAIAMVDQMLFNGLHHQQILDPAKEHVVDKSFASYTPPLDKQAAV